MWGALKNIPEDPSQIPQFIESLPHPGLKTYVREYLNNLEKQRIGDVPFSNSELKRWERLEAQGEYKELYREKAKRIEKWILENKGLVNELLNPDPLREQIMKSIGIPYSPLFGLYSLTAYVFVRLFGLENEELFGKLLTHIARLNKKLHGKPWYFYDPMQALNLSPSKEKERRIKGKDREKFREEISDLHYPLIETIRGFSKKPVLFYKESPFIVEAIEAYLYTCVDNALMKRWKKQALPKGIEFEEVKVETIKAEPKSVSVLLEEAVMDLTFNDPIDKIIANNYGKSDSKIAAIVEENLDKRMTKQAIQKRRKCRVNPVIGKSLEIKPLMTEDERRQGFKFKSPEGEREKPLLRDIYQCQQCKKHFLTLHPLNRCGEHAGEKPFRM
jgi:hypothetical protein